MYIWKYKNITLKKQTEAGKQIGLSRQWICRICSQKEKVRKLIAYTITKYIDNEAEIEDFFERVE